MLLHVAITGKSPLVLNNGRLADPLWDVSRAIAEITSKRGMTLEDQERLADLQWRGALYYDREIGVYVPAANIVRCLRNAATEWKLGQNVFRAVNLQTDTIPLQHDGPRDINALAKRDEFRWRSTVVYGNRRRLPKTWPTFRVWALAFDVELATDELDVADFERIIERAGRLEGLGDGRRLGKGRFVAEVHA